jgi:CHAT domain-containing protein
LPTVEESRRVRSFFDPDLVTALESEQATKRAVLARIKGQRVVHLAAHGFADDRFGNLFGAIALTPPRAGTEAPDDDGFLSLHEIYQLPLGDCDLAVLSACSTNVGPQRPLEAGVTLASGFLAAGARRVVASHWSIDDRSTAELIGAFFEKVIDDRRRGRAHYALALQNAKKAIRARPEFSAPFFWAPFVLIGSGDQE